MGANCTCTVSKKGNEEDPLALIPDLVHMQLSKKYVTGKKLAAKVFCVRHALSHSVRVCYQLRKDNFPCQDGLVISERIKSLRTIDHPNICTLHEALNAQRYLYLIYEHMDSKLLLDKLAEEEAVSEHRAAGLMRQVVLALNCGLEHNIEFHGAILPKNLSLNKEGQIKVTDFGLAGYMKRYPVDQPDKDHFGALAPEVVKPWCDQQSKWKTWNSHRKVKLEAADYARTDIRSDIWSLGVVLFLILTGSMPFFGVNVKEVADKVLKEAVVFPSTLSQACQDLLMSMLTHDPQKRPSVKDLMAHPWICETVAVSDKPACPRICEHLKTFNEERHFKKAMMRFIAGKVPRRRISSLYEQFHLLDINGDGMITLEEFKAGLAKHPNLCKDANGNGDDIEQAFKEIDHNGSGSISLQEFIAATIDSQVDIVDALLWDAFRTMDSDGSGYLTLAEMEGVLHKLEGQLGNDHIEMMMHLLEDELKDGKMCFSEFKRLVMDEGGKSAYSTQLMEGGLPCCAEQRRRCRTIIRAN